MSENVPLDICVQSRFRSSCAFAKSDRSFHWVHLDSHYEHTLFKYIKNFTTKKKNFQMKNSGNFHMSTQNIDCGTR